MKFATILFVGLTAFFLHSQRAEAQRTLSYQGVVQDQNGALLEGAHNVTVKLYTAIDDTAAMWEETQHPNFSHGLFAIAIGALRKLPALSIVNPGLDHYFLGVSIDGAAELSPRTMLSDAPSAFYADTAAYARSVDPSALTGVASINGLKSALKLVGAGMTNVSTHGDTITISSPAQTPDLIQGIINKDGSIDVKNGSGPVPEVSIAQLGVSTLHIAKSAVVTDRIAAAAVTNDRIASSAVTNDKIGTGTTTRGFVLSADGTGGASWQSPVAAALTLPYSTSLGSSTDLFSLTNSGSGSAIVGTSTLIGVAGFATTSSGSGVVGTTADGGVGSVANAGVSGTTVSGYGLAGVASSGNGTYGVANTTGIGVHGVTAAGATTARAGVFENLSSSATGNVLEAKALGTGSAGLFQVSNSASNAIALDVSTTGTGRAGRFQISNGSSSANALEVSTSGTGAALQATSATSSSTGTTAFVQNTGSAGIAIQGDHTGSGTGVAGYADGAGNTARGVFGWASNSSGTGVGVYGQSEGQSTNAIFGLANNTVGNGVGVYGQTRASGGSAAGLYGWASNTSGTGYGVWGQAEGVGADAIVGLANNTTGNGVGLYGLSNGASGVGVYGQTNGTASNSYGVSGNTGTTSSTAGNGVFGTTAGTGAGVAGSTTNTTASAGSGFLSGVFGISSNAAGYGVQGQNSTSTGTGILGLVTSTGAGVYGQNSGTGVGVKGIVGTSVVTTFTPSGVTGIGFIGTQGATTSSTGYGVYGTASGSSGRGVYGTALSPSGSAGSGTGVFAEASSTGNALIAQYIGTNTSSTTQANIAIFKSGTSPVNVARIDKNGVGYFNGGTQNSGADVAEALVPVGLKSAYEPGDVLVLSKTEATHIERSSAPYSNCVAGVYATKPGVLLTTEAVDADLTGHVPMGVIGILPTKVSAENGPIEVGDLLVTSSTPGYAMKGDESKLHFGNILGKAMEPLASGKGTIRVLVGKY